MTHRTSPGIYPTSVPFAETFSLHSEVLHEERSVYVRVPESYRHGMRRYPVLYVLDGELPHFLSHCGVITHLSEWGSSIPEMIVVGIPNTERPRDMLPTAIELPNGRMHGGGARTFLAFLTDELAPIIDQIYRTHSYRILSGTSASGLAASFAMLSRLEGFRAFFASSPTVGFDERSVFEMATAQIPHLSERTFYALFSGDADMEGIECDCREFAQLLNRFDNPALEVHHWVHPGEGHCPVDGFRRALLTLFTEWEPDDKTLEGGREAIVEHYAQQGRSLGFKIELPVSSYEAVAERLLGAERFDEAVDFLKEGLEHYPREPRIVFYLAIAQARSGDRAGARERLEKTLKHDQPGTHRLRYLLRQLQDG